MLDIAGFLTSTEFLGQLAMLITTIISTVLTSLISGFFGVGA
jgi:hypothetical protein